MPTVSRPGAERLIRHPLSQIALFCLALILLEYNVLLMRAAARFHWNDFGKFYHALLNWRAGLPLYAPTEATNLPVGEEWVQFLDMNPPHFHLVILPFLGLPERAAGGLWLTLNLIAGAAACLLTLRELRIRIRYSHLLPWGCLILASGATSANSLTAQCTGILMLPITLAWLAARQHRWAVCGSWLGVLVSVKPFLGLLLLIFAAQRRWRCVVAASITCSASFLLGCLVFGVTEYVAWIGALRQVNWTWASMNGSVAGLFARTLDSSAAFAPLAARGALVTPLWLTAAAAIAWLSYRRTTASVDHAFGLGVIVSLLISPLGWVYYLWLALPGCLAVCHTHTPGAVWAGLGVLCVPLIFLAVGQPHPLLTLTLGSAYSWGTLALWAGLLQTAGPRPVTI